MRSATRPATTFGRRCLATLIVFGALTSCTTNPAAVVRSPSVTPGARACPTPSTRAFELRAGRQSLSLIHDGLGRTSFVQLPTGYNSTVPAPLLVSLHPFALTNQGWEDYSHLADAATARGYVVVSPLGSDPGPRWSVPGGLPGPDDLGFVDQLVASVAAELCIDTTRIFAAGFSAGAAMAMGLSCTYPGLFAGVAASGGANLTSLCPESPGVDTLILHGLNDPISPTSGSYVVFAPPLGLNLFTVLSSTAARNGCDQAVEAVPEFAFTDVRRYVGCDAGHRLQFWQMSTAGHTWAGTDPVIGAFLGGTSQDFSANTVVLDFFDGHTVAVPAT